MRGRVLLLSVLACASCAAAWADEPPAAPAPVLPEPQIYYMGTWTAEHADISPPLRDIPPAPRRGQKTDKDDPGPLTPCGPIDGFDPVAQITLGVSEGEAPTTMPAPNVSFNAFANDCGGCAPPDPNGDVGPNHVVVMANSSLAIYSKTGTKLWPTSAAAADINTLWTGFGGKCEAENAGDPVVLYDQVADRWLVSQFTAASAPYYNCVCLSTSGDPTGTWQRYAISNDPNGFPDYPKYGIWRDGYYFSTRNTDMGTQGVYALNRDQMLAGSLTPQVVSFVLGSNPAYYGGDGLLPADMDGSILPPAGSPEFFFGSMDNGGPYSAPSDAINVFAFHVDWTHTANSTFTRTATVPVAAFDSTFTPCGGSRTCIPQPGTTNKVDTLSYRQRLTFRAAYRNYGTHESVALTQSVSGYNSGLSSAIAGMRWYELRDPNGTPTIFQQGTYVPGATDGTHRWMGSVAMDRVGNMGLAFSASSGSVYPSIWYTGRLASDPLGTMPQGEGTLVDGAGSQTGGNNRWGDYTSLNVDPVDDCTFWHFNEFYTTTSSSTWQMRVGSFTFPNCLCAAVPAPPAGGGAEASGENTIAVSWSDAEAPSIARYFLFRSEAAGGPYTQIATTPDATPGVGGSGSYTYEDGGRSGGSRYYYAVKADDGVACTSGYSEEVDALAEGPCLLAPAFAGATSVTDGGGATCTLTVVWSAGVSRCSGPLTYNVYRSTASGFTPGASTLIASGVSGTSYADTHALVPGTIYYYVVRAVDAVNGREEENLVARTGFPTGPPAYGTWSDDGGDTSLPKLALQSTWTNSETGGRTGARCYATGVYPASACISATTPTLNVGAGGGTLTFWSRYDIQLAWDKGQVELSTDGGTTFSRLAITSYPTNSNYTVDACGLPGGQKYFTGTGSTYASYKGTLPQGSAIKIRWRLSSNNATQNTGWWIDDITVTNTLVGGSCATVATRPGEAAPGDLPTTAQAWSADKATHSWPALARASEYTVTRGTPAQLASLAGSTPYPCTRYTGTATSFTETQTPPSDSFYWYLVVGSNSGGAGSSGNGAGGERTVNSSGICTP